MAMYNNEIAEKLAKISEDINTTSQRLLPLLTEYVRGMVASDTLKRIETQFGTLTLHIMRNVDPIARYVRNLAGDVELAFSPSHPYFQTASLLRQLIELENDKRELKQYYSLAPVAATVRSGAAPRKSRNARRRKQRKTRRSNRR